MKAPPLQQDYSSLEESHTPTPRPPALSAQRLNRFLSLEGYFPSTCTSAPPSSRPWPPRSPCRHEAPPALETAGPPLPCSRPALGNDGSSAATTHQRYCSWFCAVHQTALPTPIPSSQYGSQPRSAQPGRLSQLLTTRAAHAPPNLPMGLYQLLPINNRQRRQPFGAPSGAIPISDR